MSGVGPAVIVVLCLILVGSGIWFYVRKKKARALAASLAEAVDDWDLGSEVRKKIESDSGIRFLYSRLGFAPWLERKLEEQTGELAHLILASIPDFRAFRKAVSELQVRYESTAVADDPIARAWTQRKDDDLLAEVVEAGDDQPRVLALLNRDPVHEPLPFLVEMPFYRDGKLTWRTPVGVSLIRKTPGDPAWFAHRLYEIESLVRTAKIRRSTRLTQGVLQALGRLRKDLRAPFAYFPTGLKELEGRLADWLEDVPNGVSRDRRAQLDCLISELVSIQHATSREGWAEAGDFAEFRDSVTQQTRRYLDSPWLHTDGLTQALLVHLLDVELPRCEHAKAKRLLDAVREEVRAGFYDGEENARRLRQLETHGFFVNSLVYSLLRLSDRPAGGKTEG